VTSEPQPHDADTLIDLYRAIEHCSRAMLAAALEGDWDAVSREQQQCTALIDQTRQLVPTVTLPKAEQRTRMQIMRQILQNEAVIRRLAHPWTERLERQLFPSVAAGGRV
jgi:flagellar protein FliT